MKWKEALLRECYQAYIRGGEITIIFIRRADKVIPIIKRYIDNQIKCDEETIPQED